MPNQESVLAIDIARECSRGLGSFANEVFLLFSQFETPAIESRAEICVLVFAMMHATLRSSSLSVKERARLIELIAPALEIQIQNIGFGSVPAPATLESRVERYLLRRDEKSQVKTATGFAELVGEAVGATPAQAEQILISLGPICAHRMLADVYRLNELRARHGIQLALWAAIITVCQLAALTPSSAPRIRDELSMHDPMPSPSMAPRAFTSGAWIEAA